MQLQGRVDGSQLQLLDYVKHLENEVEQHSIKLSKTVDRYKLINDHLAKIATVIDHINELSFAINTTQDIEDIFNSISYYARNLTSSEYCLVMIVTEEGTLAIGSVAGVHRSNRPVNILQSNNGLCGKVIEEGRPIRVNNIKNGNNNGNGNVVGLHLNGLSVRDFMGVPFFSKGKTAGELVVLNKKEPSGFTMEDHEMLITLGNQAANALENKKLQDLEKETQLIVMIKMAQLAEKRDPETGSHLDRIKFYSQLLAEEMRSLDNYKHVIDDNFIRAVFEASPLHDIGKVGIPDGILLKPGKLSREEFDVMKQHTTIGGNILEGPAFLEIGKDIALWHHEKYNGTGYPGRLSGGRIPLCARIVALSDVYDAITSDRVYKSAYPHEMAVEFIKGESGKHFDPDVVTAFLNRAEEFAEIKAKTRD